MDPGEGGVNPFKSSDLSATCLANVRDKIRRFETLATFSFI
jgi:hypothetical protein